MKKYRDEELDRMVEEVWRKRHGAVPDYIDMWAKLSPEAFLRRFIRFDLAAGKFPLSREAPSLLSPGYQDPPVFLYHSGSDDERIVTRCCLSAFPLTRHSTPMHGLSGLFSLSSLSAHCLPVTAYCSVCSRPVPPGP